MKSFVQFFIRFFTGGLITLLIFVVSLLAFDVNFIPSVLYGVLGGLAVFFLLKWMNMRQFLRSNGLTRREYQYIKRNLKEAKLKINRLHKAFLRSRSFAHMRQNMDIIRIVNRIYTITKKEPRRFFRAEQFYFSHLDSIVELSEKYAFLHTQPSKTPELLQSLRETRGTIQQLGQTLEKDLYKILEDDIDHLQFELDVAKQRLNKQPMEIDDRRKS